MLTLVKRMKPKYLSFWEPSSLYFFHLCFASMQPTLDYVWWTGKEHYGLLKFTVCNVRTLISLMIKTPLINQYLGSHTDWSELLFSVVSSVHACGEMLRLTGSVIKKKRQNTPKLVS